MKAIEYWQDNKGLKCVVLCAGRGRRIRPASAVKPKVMQTVKHKPILGYVVDYWQRYTQDFIFVVHYKKEHIISYANSLSVKVQFVEQKELKGIADAVMCVRELVADNFIVALGDCLCRGEFDFPPATQQGVGVWQADNVEDIKRSYSIEIKNSLVSRVVEKPQQVTNNLCGMGFYFFNRRIFNYIEQMKASPLRGEIEITDTIQHMIDGGEEISPVLFNGDYLNVTYPEDIVKAERLFQDGNMVNDNVNIEGKKDDR